MASVIEIANTALVGLGGEPIASLIEQTTNAIIINSNFSICRRALLRKHTWNFALKRVNLARSTTIPNHAYEYRYALPADYIRLIQVYSGADYKVENGFILTNAESCQIKYVADIVDTRLWTSDFTDMMVTKLQMEIAYAVTRDANLTKLYTNIYTMKIADALWSDASEDCEDPIPFMEDGLIGVRN